MSDWLAVFLLDSGPKNIKRVSRIIIFSSSILFYSLASLERKIYGQRIELVRVVKRIYTISGMSLFAGCTKVSAAKITAGHQSLVLLRGPASMDSIEPLSSHTYIVKVRRVKPTPSFFYNIIYVQSHSFHNVIIRLEYSNYLTLSSRLNLLVVELEWE